MSYGDGALAVINARNNTKVTDIKLPAHPESFRLQTNGPRMFVNIPGADHFRRGSGEKDRNWHVVDERCQGKIPLILDEPIIGSL